jgi:hypothetical protein
MHRKKTAAELAGLSALWICLGLPALFSGQGESPHVAFSCPPVRKILREFEFVGEKQCQDTHYFAHTIVPMPTPDIFHQDICYVYQLPASTNGPVYEFLEKRLRANGFTIQHSPSIDHDLIHLFSGGPLFRIEFRNERHVGVIAAVQDPQVSSSTSLRRLWKSEDFVLLFRQ